MARILVREAKGEERRVLVFQGSNFNLPNLWRVTNPVCGPRPPQAASLPHIKGALSGGKNLENRLHIEHCAAPGAAADVLKRGPESRVVRQRRIPRQIRAQG